MAPKQKMRLANEKHSKNVANRGNVPKSLASVPLFSSDFEIILSGAVFLGCRRGSYTLCNDSGCGVQFVMPLCFKVLYNYGIVLIV